MAQAACYDSPAADRELLIGSTARSHVGRVRLVNEDRLLDRSDRRLWAIADGMGGHHAGDAAAATAIAALEALADAAAPITDAGVAAALHDANRRIAADRSTQAPSGTTIVAAYMTGDRVAITWAGDSRCYLLRGGEGHQLNRDHSVVQDLVEAGRISLADAARHPQAHVITRALGVDPVVELDTVAVAVEPGDRLLLCSDGLSRSLAAHDFAFRGSVEVQADRLLTNALQRDGTDNISLVLIAIDAPPDQAADGTPR